MAHREDIALEVNDVLDGTGQFFSEWVDSSDVLHIGIRYAFGGGSGVSVVVQESPDAGTVIMSGSSVPSGGGEAGIYCRYFRLAASGGSPGAAFVASIRSLD